MRWSSTAGVSACSIMPWPSLQAYVNRFKFQSITADDALGFFLEYFPELKEKGVDSIPGQCLPGQGTGLCFANQHPWVSEPLCVPSEPVHVGLCVSLETTALSWPCPHPRPGLLVLGMPSEEAAWAQLSLPPSLQASSSAAGWTRRAGRPSCPTSRPGMR